MNKNKKIEVNDYATIFTYPTLIGRYAGAIVESQVKCAPPYVVNNKQPLEYFFTGLQKQNMKNVIFFIDYIFCEEENIDLLLNLLEDGVTVIWIDNHAESWDIIQGVYEECSEDMLENLIPVIEPGESVIRLTWEWCAENLYDNKDVPMPLPMELMARYEERNNESFSYEGHHFFGDSAEAFYRAERNNVTLECRDIILAWAKFDCGFDRQLIFNPSPWHRSVYVEYALRRIREGRKISVR